MATKICLADGCKRYRHVTSSGVVKGYCLEHMREKNRQWTHDRAVRIAEEKALTVVEPETIKAKSQPRQRSEPEDILASMFLLLGRAKEAVAAGEVDQVQLAIVVRTDAEGHNVKFSMNAEAED